MGGGFVHRLLQESAHVLLVVQGGVHQRVGPGLVGADVDQVLCRLAGGEDPAQRGGGVEVRRGS